MEDLNKTFSENLVRLRKEKKLTQLELAEQLSYSDKNISKWENGLALPSADVMVEISRFFGVSMDYLISPHKGNDHKGPVMASWFTSRIIILFLSMLCPFLIATIIFICFPNAFNYSWISYIYALPVSCICAIVFTALWFRKKPFLFIAISCLVWTLLLSVYLSLVLFADINFWYIFLTGIPLQLGIILWSMFPAYKRR